ncbi:unnamed protein product, partial [Discosporangium mesarthrocarpum]
LAFVDGTLRPHCSSIYGDTQNATYSGYERVHSLKFQGLELPNGLLCDLHGPVAGSRHDVYMLGRINLNPKVVNMPEGAPVQYVVYGDTAYPNLSHVTRGYRQTPSIQPGQVASNWAMSVVRISTEWSFGKLVQQFPFLVYEKNPKLHLQPTAKLYLAAAFLIDMHTCLYGSVTGRRFEQNPLKVEGEIHHDE